MKYWWARFRLFLHCLRHTHSQFFWQSGQKRAVACFNCGKFYYNDEDKHGETHAEDDQPG